MKKTPVSIQYEEEYVVHPGSMASADEHHSKKPGDTEKRDEVIHKGHTWFVLKHLVWLLKPSHTNMLYSKYTEERFSLSRLFAGNLAMVRDIFSIKNHSTQVNDYPNHPHMPLLFNGYTQR